MRFLFAGGGTGGHLCPGLALAKEIQELCPSAEMLFVGTGEGLERTMVPAAGFDLVMIAAGRGSPLSLRRPMNLPRFIFATAQSLRLLRRLRPAAVVALGGYAAAPAGLAARIKNLPLAVLEQNTIPGRVNGMLARWAAVIFSQFAEAKARFGQAADRVRVSGSPLREPFLRLAADAPVRGDALLVIGGSQGARRLNEIVTEAVPAIVKELRCPVIHVAGAEKVETVRRAYAMSGVDADVQGFSDTMADNLARSKLVISRAGAMSLAELAAAGVPAVLVPLPSAKDDHQRANARVVADCGGAVMLDEPSLTGETLAAEVIGLWRDEVRLEAMAGAMRGMARPAAGKEIAAAILDLAGANDGDG